MKEALLFGVLPVLAVAVLAYWRGRADERHAQHRRRVALLHAVASLHRRDTHVRN